VRVGADVERMKKTIALLAAAVLVVAAGAVSARADGDPVAAAKADVQQLVTDATALHSTVVADAQKITADAQSLQGTTDVEAARETLKADVQKLRADRQQLVPPVLADWKQLRTDLEAVRAAHAGTADLRSTLEQARETLRQEREDVRTALEAARQAMRALRQSLASK